MKFHGTSTGAKNLYWQIKKKKTKHLTFCSLGNNNFNRLSLFWALSISTEIFYTWKNVREKCLKLYVLYVPNTRTDAEINFFNSISNM